MVLYAITQSMDPKWAVWLIVCNLPIFVLLTNGLRIFYKRTRVAGDGVLQHILLVTHAGVVTAVLHTALATIPGEVFGPKWSALDLAEWTFPGLVRMSVVYIAWSSGYLYCIHAVIIPKAKLRLRELEESALRAELTALQVQTQPHFLLNVLNMIDAEADDPEKARMITRRLAGHLRGMLAQGQSLVRADSQIQDCLHYLEIQRERFGNRLSWEVHSDSISGSYCLPGLSLQILVENAIKHGLERNPGPMALEISLHSTEGHLVLEVSNTGSWVMGGAQGTGLANLRRRMELLFPGSGSLEHRCDQTHVRLRLCVPAVEAVQ